MNDEAIFEHLFEVAARSKDPRGIVSACLVVDGKVFAEAASGDDGVAHAEDILFDTLKKANIIIPENASLYATLEPCNKRSKPGMIDCVSLIIEANIKSVVFGARDPGQSTVTKERLEKEGIELKQISNPDIIKRCAEVFNESVTEEHKGVDVILKPTE